MNPDIMLLQIECKCGDPQCVRTLTILEGYPREALYHGNGLDQAAELSNVLVERYNEDEESYVSMPESASGIANTLLVTFNEATALLFLGATEITEEDF